MYSMVLMAALTTATDMPDFGRRGGWGCCGCYGGYGWGCGGCYGGYGWGGWGGWGGYGCYGWGGWGGWGGYGGYVYTPVISTYAAPVMVASNILPAASTANRSMYYSPYTSRSRATIIVHVPANAQLMVDGKPTVSTSSTRRFSSPPLEPGKTYHYVFQARMNRDGQIVKADKRVDIRAGDTREIRITVPDLNRPSESQPPKLLPEEKRNLPERPTRNEPR